MDMSSFGNGPGGFLSRVVYIEKSFNAEAAKQWSDSAKSLSLWFSAIYVILIFGGQRWMQSRSPFKLQIPLFLWNAVLSIFSIMGAFHMVPELYSSLVDHGWNYSVCDPSFYVGSTGFWTFAFIWSKPYELGDTIFLVLRRQPLIFLHWYHHITVMIYSIYSYPEHVSAARWYLTLNYFVHSIMYTYFALRALHLRAPALIRMSVTFLQILQMIIALVVSVSVVIIKFRGGDCNQTYYNASAAILMYFSYLVLFGNFFYQQYAVPAYAVPAYAVPARKKPPRLSNDKTADIAEEPAKKLE